MELNEFKLCLYSDDGSLKKDMHISRFYDLLNEAAVKTGTPSLPPSSLRIERKLAKITSAFRKAASSPSRRKCARFSWRQGLRISKPGC